VCVSALSVLFTKGVWCVSGVGVWARARVWGVGAEGVGQGGVGARCVCVGGQGGVGHVGNL